MDFVQPLQGWEMRARQPGAVAPGYDGNAPLGREDVQAFRVSGYRFALAERFPPSEYSLLPYIGNS